MTICNIQLEWVYFLIRIRVICLRVHFYCWSTRTGSGVLLSSFPSGKCDNPYVENGVYYMSQKMIMLSVFRRLHGHHRSTPGWFGSPVVAWCWCGVHVDPEPVVQFVLKSKINVHNSTAILSRNELSRYIYIVLCVCVYRLCDCVCSSVRDSSKVWRQGFVRR